MTTATAVQVIECSQCFGLFKPDGSPHQPRLVDLPQWLDRTYGCCRPCLNRLICRLGWALQNEIPTVKA